VRIPIVVEGVLGAGAFQLAPNGVTILCPAAAVGATGIVNGVTYTKRDRAGLVALVNANDFAPLATTCTSGATTLNATPSATRSFTPSVDPARRFANFEYFE
jgi:hypothetical protein